MKDLNDAVVDARLWLGAGTSHSKGVLAFMRTEYGHWRLYRVRRLTCGPRVEVQTARTRISRSKETAFY